LWLNNTDCLCFPCAAYELRHSSDLALLAKWPVFLQNAFGNPAYVNQTNLNGKLRTKLGGMAHPGPPLESPLRGINLTQIGVVNVRRYSLKVEFYKNLKKCKGGMTFVEDLEETTVGLLVGFEKLVSRFKDTAKS